MKRERERGGTLRGGESLHEAERPWDEREGKGAMTRNEWK